MLPVSAIVVGNAGWIGKAISEINPSIINPAIKPDSVFVVVSNIVSHPGVFGFIMAALSAALMSTVDTLLNAIAAIYINDVHRPVKKWMKKIKFRMLPSIQEEASVMFKRKKDYFRSLERTS